VGEAVSEPVSPEVQFQMLVAPVMIQTRSVGKFFHLLNVS